MTKVRFFKILVNEITLASQILWCQHCNVLLFMKPKNF